MNAGTRVMPGAIAGIRVYLVGEALAFHGLTQKKLDRFSFVIA